MYKTRLLISLSLAFAAGAFACGGGGDDLNDSQESLGRNHHDGGASARDGSSDRDDDSDEDADEADRSRDSDETSDEAARGDGGKGHPASDHAGDAGGCRRRLGGGFPGFGFGHVGKGGFGGFPGFADGGLLFPGSLDAGAGGFGHTGATPGHGK